MADLLIKNPERALTAKQFQQLSDVPPEFEWFANISSEKTRKAIVLPIVQTNFPKS